MIPVSLLLMTMLLASAPQQEGQAEERPAARDSAGPAAAEETKRITELLDCFRGEFKERQACRERLVELGHPVTPLAIARLEDPSWAYRWDIVNTLGYLRDIRAVPGLVGRVLNDPNPHVRWRALWAVYACDHKSGQTTALLLAALTNEDPLVSWHAAIGLSIMKDYRAVPLLHEHLDHTDKYTRWEAVNSLGRVHDATSSGRLERVLLEDADVKVLQEGCIRPRDNLRRNGTAFAPSSTGGGVPPGEVARSFLNGSM